MNKKLNEYEKKKIVKCIILSILLFVVATIWCEFEVAKNLYTGENSFIGFFIFTLPYLIISLFFVREKKFRDSIIFGAVIGFMGGTLFLIYEIAIPIVAAPDPSTDYALLPVYWTIITMFFTGSSVIGSSLSYFIRKLLEKSKRS